MNRKGPTYFSSTLLFREGIKKAPFGAFKC